MGKSRDIADSAATINFIDSLTSDVQSQLNAVPTLVSPTFTGTVTATSFSGSYANLHASVSVITTSIDFNNPVNTVTLLLNTTFTEANKAEGKSSILKLATGGNTPTFSANIKWSSDTEPTWADYGYWVVALICHDGTNVFGSATGHTI